MGPGLRRDEIRVAARPMPALALPVLGPALPEMLLAGAAMALLLVGVFRGDDISDKQREGERNDGADHGTLSPSKNSSAPSPNPGPPRQPTTGESK